MERFYAVFNGKNQEKPVVFLSMSYQSVSVEFFTIVTLDTSKSYIKSAGIQATAAEAAKIIFLTNICDINHAFLFLASEW